MKEMVKKACADAIGFTAVVISMSCMSLITVIQWIYEIPAAALLYLSHKLDADTADRWLDTHDAAVEVYRKMDEKFQAIINRF